MSVIFGVNLMMMTVLRDTDEDMDLGLWLMALNYDYDYDEVGITINIIVEYFMQGFVDLTVMGMGQLWFHYFINKLL